MAEAAGLVRPVESGGGEVEAAGEGVLHVVRVIRPAEAEDLILGGVVVHRNGVLALILRGAADLEEVRVARESAIRQRIGAEERHAVRALAIRWDDVVRERLAGERIVDRAGRTVVNVAAQQFAEVAVTHGGARHALEGGLILTELHPLLREKEEKLFAVLVE